ncbi:NAD(P)H-binding protein [Nocardiopsis sp. NPDC050513]|uniref:NAD(P)H-binding protein n=1 Tax=Nocardiopsis sp. NPDC050513 TaxID=3364338 RepID=UPI0037A6582D
MIVVTGATGNVGRPLVRALAEAGEKVLAVARTVAERDVPAGVLARRADLADPGALAGLLEGADAVFVHDGGAAGGLDARGVVAAAGEAGVGRLVLLSSQAVATRPASASHGGTAGSLEDAVRAWGGEWTILRPSGFATNALAWAGSVRSERTVRAPFGDVALPVVDPEDVARVAARVLGGGGHDGRVYTLTGPAAVTPRRQTEAIAAALGEPVAFVELTREQARAAMARFMPEPVVETTLSILGEPTAEERRVSDGVERVLGRPAGSFADWARRNAAAFG